MAKDTQLTLRNKSIYQVYNRQHNVEGTFLALIRDLKRIRDLGFDILYLLPIHPIGKERKKGHLGCPYSIADYKEVNPEYGTLDDFKVLLDAAKDHNLTVMIDIVFNHTSHDARLLSEHPEWYYRKDGKLAGKVGDWWDVTDLDFSHEGLWDELIDTLRYWAKMGVGGFRCDVASVVPLEFWIRARDAVRKINPEFIWLAESVHDHFVRSMRNDGHHCASDSEVFEAFDIAYDYDISTKFEAVLKDKLPLNVWVEALLQQESIYPANYVKLRCLENHDQPRIASVVENEKSLRNWTAAMFFLKGTVMIYAGQETTNTHRPDLFDIDKIDWSTYDKSDIATLIQKMNALKKQTLFADGIFDAFKLKKSVLCLTWSNDEKTILGIYNIKQEKGEIEVPIRNGKYVNYLDGKTVFVVDKKCKLSSEPMILEIEKNTAL